MKMVLYTVGTVVAVIFVIAWCNDGHAQAPPSVTFGGSSSNSSTSSSSQSGAKSGSVTQNHGERCIRDSFGNLTCTESRTRIITDSNGNISIIPMPR